MTTTMFYTFSYDAHLTEPLRGYPQGRHGAYVQITVPKGADPRELMLTIYGQVFASEKLTEPSPERCPLGCITRINITAAVAA